MRSLLQLLAIGMFIGTPLYGNDLIPMLYPIQNSEAAYISTTVELVPNSFPLAHESDQYQLNDHLRFSARSSEPIVVQAPARGVIQRIARYKMGDSTFFELTITHSNGFISTISGLTEISVAESAWISQGEVLGTVVRQQASPREGLRYRLTYLGHLVNPEILFFALSGDDLSLYTLIELTRHILEFELCLRDPNDHILNMTYNSKQFNFDVHEHESIFGTPYTTEIHSFGDSTRPEYDQIVFMYDGFSTSRFRYSETIQQIAIEDPDFLLFDKIHTGISLNSTLTELGPPVRIHFKGPAPSTRVAQYILQNSLPHASAVQGVDYSATSITGKPVFVYFDLNKGEVIQIILGFQE